MDIEQLNIWNPWWNKQKVSEKLKGIERNNEKIIYKSIFEKEIIVLTGIRRSGKSTIMYQLISKLLENNNPKQIFYINLDDEILKKEGLENIYSGYKQKINPDKKTFMFIDEIQNAINWEKFLKKYYDLQANIKFIISGSSSNLLKGDFSSLLTGRNITFSIYPLSFKEYLEFSNIDINEKDKIFYKFEEFIEYGGFPEIFFKEKEFKKIVLKQYFDDIMYKDIIKRYNVNANKISDTALYLLTNISNPYTVRKIRNFTGLSIDSIRDYLSYLHEAYLIYSIDFFSYSLKDSSFMPKKCYSSDQGLRNFVSFKFSKDLGKIVENIVFIELIRRNKNVFYWKNKGEVDFVVKNDDNTLCAINVTFSDNINERELKSLIEFKSNFKKTDNLILLTKDIEKHENGIKYIPLWKWLLDLK